MDFDNYDNSANGNFNDMITPRYDFTGYSSIKLTFDRAYKEYSSDYMDSFAILISTDCGATFSEIYLLPTVQLATVPGTGTYTSPSPGDWQNDSVDLSPYIGQSAIIDFRNIGHYGNYLFIDNINITGTVTANAGAAVAICAGDSVMIGGNSTGGLVYNWILQQV